MLTEIFKKYGIAKLKTAVLTKNRTQMTNIELKDMSYSWKETTLSEFLEEGNVPEDWRDFFHNGNIQDILTDISSGLAKESRILYPPLKDVFRAFYMTPLHTFKVVLLGQDPYHSGTHEFDGSAMGLAFSVRPGNPINPSLRNIYKELVTEGFSGDGRDGDLRAWTSHTLLLNMALTVAKGEAGSHSCLWNDFSQELIKYIDEKRGNTIVWFLFGNEAQGVAGHIRHGKIERTSHPSPFSCFRATKTAPAFIGSGIFRSVGGIQW